MAAPGGVPGAGFAPNALPTASYHQYFSDANNDPFNGDYATALTNYSVPLVNNNNVATPAAVREQACSSITQGLPSAFILLHPDNKLHIYIQLARFNARLGLPPTPWDDNMYIQKGDLHHNQSVIVQWQDDYFHQVNMQIRVPTPAALDTLLAADLNADALGPFNAQDADTELIRVRRTCYIPPAYVPTFLASPLTPRQAWELVRGQIVADNREAHCAAIINFLRAALTRSQNNQPVELRLAAAPTAPVADEILLTHRRRIVESDFPQLNQALPQLQQHQIATQLGLLIQDRQAERAEARAAKQRDERGRLSDLVGAEGVAYLMRLTNVGNEAALPDIWRSLAEAKKSQRITALQHAVDVMKQQCAEGPDLQFEIIGSTLQMVLNRSFHMQTNDSIGTGLQPFMFPQIMPEEAIGLRTAYVGMYSGNQAPSHADFQEIMKTKLGAPVSMLHARHMMRRVEILLKVILGEHHPLPVNLTTFLNRFSAFEAVLEQTTTRQRKQLIPTVICRRIALQLSLYFKTFRQTVAGTLVLVPNFCQLYDDIAVDNPWEATVPVPVLSQLGFNTHQPSPSLPYQSTPLPTSPPSVPSGSAPAPAVRERLQNTQYSNMFQRFREMPTVRCSDLRKKIKDNALPALPVSKVDGAPMCLAWHARGECSSNCSRKSDHVSYTDAEYQPLVDWCNKHFRAN